MNLLDHLLPRRRALALGALSVLPLQAGSAAVEALEFPRDLGAHPDTHIEWWYVTGHAAAGVRRFGFQVTFFRTRIAATQQMTSRLAARQLLFAHAAVTDLQAGRLLHDQRIGRWNGVTPAAGMRNGGYFASMADTQVAVDGWSLTHEDGLYRTRIDADGFALALDFRPTQALLLQGDAGLSRKGPDVTQSSRYYSVPQLAVSGTLAVQGRRFVLDASARSADAAAWLDHEWSDAFLHPDAVGWDWIGMNLFDGSALTAFRLRRKDGSALWAGGSYRPQSAGPVQNFGPGEVDFVPAQRWTSPHTRATYPVQWTVRTPVGSFTVRALLDDQELDSRTSTGAVYWEGVSALSDAGGRLVGRGYLEMTGYVSPLKL